MSERLRNGGNRMGEHIFDMDANIVFDRATSGLKLRFHKTDEMCPRCQRDLEVYYCEKRTYAVRCKHCYMVTLVKASNPSEAAEKVGLHVTLERHGRWIDRDGKTWCDKCGASNKAYKPPFCPHCGARMDAKDTNVPTTK